ncbi:DUF4276 family protein [Synechococcus sp. PCC 7336]|uniref:DUF4276 family protein n=1 Tax=Synechococcus sp. PCC 7336 TaxID=195250 RepID=UPI00034758CF|nr:DUF4276 family protein [Synechococcus sp. PCC 7336]
MHIEFLVEEYSAEVALNNILPKILPGISFKIHSFQGKYDLLKKLPDRLKGYNSWMPKDCKSVVLCDRDNEDCLALKKQLDNFAKNNGLVTKSHANGGIFTVLNRIAIEELEAWFLGDPSAIARAYPKVPKNFATQSRYRNPDEIKGGTWEALQSLLQSKSYFPGGLNKVQAARQISQFMDPSNNRSVSFNSFRSGLSALIQLP